MYAIIWRIIAVKIRLERYPIKNVANRADNVHGDSNSRRYYRIYF